MHTELKETTSRGKYVNPFPPNKEYQERARNCKNEPNIHLDFKSTITEIKNSLKELNS